MLSCAQAKRVSAEASNGSVCDGTDEYLEQGAWRIFHSGKVSRENIGQVFITAWNATRLMTAGLF